MNECDGTGMADALGFNGSEFFCRYCHQCVRTEWVRTDRGLARVPRPHESEPA